MLFCLHGVMIFTVSVKIRAPNIVILIEHNLFPFDNLLTSQEEDRRMNKKRIVTSFI